MIYLKCPTAPHAEGCTEPPCGCGIWQPGDGWRCVNCEDPVVRRSPLLVCLWFTLSTIWQRMEWETSIEPQFSAYPRLARARRVIGL